MSTHSPPRKLRWHKKPFPIACSLPGEKQQLPTPVGLGQLRVYVSDETRADKCRAASTKAPEESRVQMHTVAVDRQLGPPRLTGIGLASPISTQPCVALVLKMLRHAQSFCISICACIRYTQLLHKNHRGSSGDVKSQLFFLPASREPYTKDTNGARVH